MRMTKPATALTPATSDHNRRVWAALARAPMSRKLPRWPALPLAEAKLRTAAGIEYLHMDKHVSPLSHGSRTVIG